MESDLRDELVAVSRGARNARGQTAGQGSAPGRRYPGLTVEEISLLLRQRQEQGDAAGENRGYQQARATVEQEIARETQRTVLVALEIVVREVVPVLEQAQRAAFAHGKAPRARTTGEQIGRAAAMAGDLGPRLAKLIRDVSEGGL